jgi:hypothetical protein
MNVYCFVVSFPVPVVVRGCGVFSVTTTKVSQTVLGRNYVMVRLSDSNDFGSL